MMQKIINIISGKGGTGKTLLTAVLAEMLGNAGANVLVVDLDIFVRGLTTLLYYQKNESIKIAEYDDLSVSDFFKNKGMVGENQKVAISRYRSFDVLPSVSSVNEILAFKDVMPNSMEEANIILENLLKHVPKEYDYIFLDSRAGYDELVAATHEVSDFSLCVEEDDNISMITSENLILQLKNNSKKAVMQIRNKVRSYNRDEQNISFGVAFVGSIPFDADVMKSFGTENFWNEIGRSAYKDALICAWNSLAKKMELNTELQRKRISPIVYEKVETRLFALSTFSRIIFVYGIVITLLSFFLIIEGSDLLGRIMYDPGSLLGIVMSLLGLALTTVAVTGKRK